jgi:hypothetical protein
MRAALSLSLAALRSRSSSRSSSPLVAAALAASFVPSVSRPRVLQDYSHLSGRPMNAAVCPSGTGCSHCSSDPASDGVPGAMLVSSCGLGVA